MEREPKEQTEWWTIADEKSESMREFRAALHAQENDKDYHKKIHERVLRMVDRIGSDENFVKMVTGVLKPPVFIGENYETQDELGRLLEEYDKEEKAKRGGKYSSKNTLSKRQNNKRKYSIKNKTNKRK